MTPQQFTDLLRQILPIIGSLLTTLGVSSGDKWTTLSNLILLIAGPIMIIGSAVYGFFQHSKAGTLTAAATLTADNGQPLVKKIELNAGSGSVETAKLNQETPSNVTVTH